MARLLLTRSFCLWLSVLRFHWQTKKLTKAAKRQREYTLRGQTRNRARHIRAQMLLTSDRCHWCPTKLDIDSSTLDHVIPAHLGAQFGRDRANLVLSCLECNQRKAGHFTGIVALPPAALEKLKQLKEQFTGV